MFSRPVGSFLPDGSREAPSDGLSFGKYGDIYADGGKRERNSFIPELAVYQLSESQKELVRPFAIPRPTRPIVLTTNKDFIRVSLLAVLKEEIRTAVPKEMLTLQAVQCLV